MDYDDFKEILKKHKKWLAGEDGGMRADLTEADLTGADLTGADLTEADLTEADLTGADLTEADLSGADLDFSSWPLWCGSFNVKVDDRIFSQLLNHVLSVDHPGARELRKLKTVVKYTNDHKESRKGWEEE